MVARAAEPIDKLLFDRILMVPFSDCWFWNGTLDRAGYGRVRHGGRAGKSSYAHREMYKLKKGDPTGLLVCHKCDVPSCVNPDHLFAGTNQDNHRDKAQKGRAAKKLTKEKVMQIRAYAETGLTHAQISEKFDVSRVMVTYVINKKYWKEI